MANWQLSTPLALIIFNRPNATRRVFEVIRQVMPSTLFVIADGPRSDHPEDQAKCAETRAVIDGVDWDCKVIKNYSDENLGCGLRPATGISWVFDQVEEAIFLEDDCIPDLSFFRFCEELLDAYRDDERIMMISGTNTFRTWKSDRQSYLFSYISTAWGWASWRRAWKHFDFQMKLWAESEVRDRVRDVLGTDILAKNFDAVYTGKIKSAWDYQWVFARLSQSGLVITPTVNLVTNVGFGEHSTHHKSTNDPKFNLPSSSVSFPLKPPLVVAPDREFDRVRFREWRKNKSLLRRSFRKIRSFFLQ